MTEVWRAESVLAVPALPKHLKKSPLLKQFDRPQLAGYDMRTLRKNIDALYQEIELRNEEHKGLYEQNSELWHYIQTLSEAHRKNALAVTSSTESLRTEFQELSDERGRLKQRILKARNAEILRNTVTKETEDMFFFIENEGEMLLRIEEQLAEARLERESLQGVLVEEQARIATFLSTVEELRDLRRDERCELIADHFFWTNKAVRRSAFKRLVQVVSSRVSLRKLSQTARSIARVNIRRRCWMMWQSFVHRRRFMKRSGFNRDIETKVIIFSRWKMHSELEGHCRKKRRLRLLQLVFNALRRNREISGWEAWAADASDALIQRRTARSHFKAWKQVCLFIEWSSAALRAAENRARAHFATRVLRAWASAAKKSRLALLEAALQVERMRFRRPFLLWRNLTWFRSGRREDMKRRFFRNCSVLIEARPRQQRLLQLAAAQCVGVKKAVALKKWRRVARGSALRGQQHRNTRALVGFNTRQHLQHTLLVLTYFSALRKRLAVANSAAARHHTVLLLRFWHKLASHKSRRREVRRLELMRRVWAGWVAFVPLQRQIDRQASGVRSKFTMVAANQQLRVLRRWRVHVRRRRFSGRCAASLRIKLAYEMTRRFMSMWRGEWTRAVYWREKESRLERGRCVALGALKGREVEDLEEERLTLLRTGRELVTVVSQLEEAIVARERDLKRQQHLLKVAAAHKEELEGSLGEVQSNLELVSRERERLRAVEILFESERQRDSRVVEERRSHAEAIIRKLQDESDALKGDMLEAREQAFLIERAAKEDVSLHQDLLSRSQWTRATLKDLVGQKQAYVDELEQSVLSMQGDMSQMQARIQETTCEGLSLLDDGEAELRRRSLAVKSLRATKGQAEARVQALRDILRERRQELGTVHLENTALNEARELNEMQSLLSVSPIATSHPISLSDDVTFEDSSSSSSVPLVKPLQAHHHAPISLSSPQAVRTLDASTSPPSSFSSETLPLSSSDSSPSSESENTNGY